MDQGESTSVGMHGIRGLSEVEKMCSKKKGQKEKAGRPSIIRIVGEERC